MLSAPTVYCVLCTDVVHRMLSGHLSSIFVLLLLLLQEGVFRTNCVDCLDRTNVVQGMLGRHQLEGLLVELGVLQPKEDLVKAMPQVIINKCMP